MTKYSSLFTSSLTKVKQLSYTSFVAENIIDLYDETYEYVHKVDFREDKYSIASSGGAILIAHACDMNDEGYYKSLSVYDSFGKTIVIIPLEHQEKLIDLHITPEESVVVVYINGLVCAYNLRGHLITEKNVLHDENSAISFTVFYDNGLFYKEATTLYLINDFGSLESEKFCDIGHTYLPSPIAIPPNTIQSTGHIIWGYNENGKIITIQKDSLLLYDFPQPVDGIFISPDREFVVIRCQYNYYFCEADLSSVLYSASVDDFVPSKVVWSGSDCLVLVDDKRLAFVGASSESFQMQFNTAVVVNSESDGVRIFSRECIQLVRAIPENVLDFAIWNTQSPAVQIFIKMHDKEYRALRDTISEYSLDQVEYAVNTMLDSATFFMKFKLIKALLIAVARALAEVPAPDDGFSETSRRLLQIRDFSQIGDKLQTLRVCVQMQREPYSIPITFDELSYLTSSVLVKRLCNRSLHFEAFRIAQYLGIDSSFISAHWAVLLIDVQKDSDKIKERLQKMTEPVDLVDLAETAFQKHKGELANELLEMNPSKSRGVPLLIEQGEWQQAINAAVESGDTSLILYTLSEAKKYGEDEIVSECIKSSINARGAWAQYCIGDERDFALSLTKKDAADKALKVIKGELKEAKGLSSFYNDMISYAKNLEAFKDKASAEMGVEITEKKPDLILEAIFRGVKYQKLEKDAAKLMGYTQSEMLIRKFNFAVRERNAELMRVLGRTCGAEDIQKFTEKLQIMGDTELMNAFLGIEESK